MHRKMITVALVILLWISASPLWACTIIMAVKDGYILIGNNEDRSFFQTTMRVFPATEKRFGRIVFGYTDAPFQGGVNDQGLFIVDPSGNPVVQRRIALTVYQPARAGVHYFAILAALEAAARSILDLGVSSAALSFALGDAKVVSEVYLYVGIAHPSYLPFSLRISPALFPADGSTRLPQV